VLTVRETLQFSRTCQQKGDTEFSAVQEMQKLQQTGGKGHAAGAAIISLQPKMWKSNIFL